MNFCSVCCACVSESTLSSSSISEIFLSRALLSCRERKGKKGQWGRRSRKNPSEDSNLHHTWRQLCIMVWCRADAPQSNAVCDDSTRTRTQTHSNAIVVTGFTRLRADLADWKLCHSGDHTRVCQKVRMYTTKEETDFFFLNSCSCSLRHLD